MDGKCNQFNQHHSCHSVVSLKKILDGFAIFSVWQSQQKALNSDISLNKKIPNFNREEMSWHPQKQAEQSLPSCPKYNASDVVLRIKRVNKVDNDDFK